MGQMLDKALEYSVKKGYLKPNETASVRNVIQQMSSKYGFPEEWFVKKAMIEAGGFFASIVAPNGCVGVFQICRWGSVVENGGLKEVGGSLSSLAKQSATTQARLWEKYHLKFWLDQGARPPKTAAEFYIINLFPAAYLQAAKGKLDVNTPVRTVAPRAWGKQAMILYKDFNNVTKRSPRRDSGDSEVTLSSVERGLNLQIANTLGSEFVSDTIQTIANVAETTAGLLANSGQIIGQALSGTLNSVMLSGANCPPPEYTQQARIIYPGCLTKTSSPIFSNALGSGSSAPAITSLETSNKTNQSFTNDNPKFLENFKPGKFIAPMKKGSYRISSPWGWREGRMHRGIDLAAPIGVPIYAMADGKVTKTVTSCPKNGRRGDTCGGGYGNQVIINHGDASTLYAHMDTVIVRVGEEVKQGQLIGTNGNSGSSSGPHIHNEIRPGGVAVNPQSLVRY